MDKLSITKMATKNFEDLYPQNKRKKYFSGKGHRGGLNYFLSLIKKIQI